ncbi:MAG: hypothetical protein ACOWYE_11250 [Desulfatiglandales bacterium]
MRKDNWHIYVGEIPCSEKGDFWVSFESDPHMKKTKANIYGRCLPCIQNLYFQLKEGRTRIALGPAYNCWKITAVLSGLDACLLLLNEFESRYQGGHVYGKFGSGRPDSETRVVVFHTDDASQRDRIKDALQECMRGANLRGDVLISRACAVLYEGILGDWRHWQPVSPVVNPDKVGDLLERIGKTLFWSVM